MTKFLASTISLLLMGSFAQAEDICSSISCKEEIKTIESLKKELSPREAFNGDVVKVTEECISESLPSIELIGEKIHMKDANGIVAFGIITDSQDREGNPLTIQQVMKFDGKYFLNGIISDFKNATLQKILQDRLDESGWPETANTELVYDLRRDIRVQGTFLGQISNVRLGVMDSCGEVSSILVSAK